MVLYHSPDQGLFGQSVGEPFPGLPLVAALVEIGPVITFFVVVQAGVDRSSIDQIGPQIVHKGALGNTRKSRHLEPTPVGTSIFADLYQSIVRAHIKEPLLYGRFCNRSDGVVIGHGQKVPCIVDALFLSHYRQLHTILVAGQIRRHSVPRIASLIGTP